MEAKFVVFGTEQELKKHKLSEHKADLESLSRHERRAALTIPIDLHVLPHPPFYALLSTIHWLKDHL